MKGFKKISPEELSGNPFKMIGGDWMLVTAQNGDGKVNTMTASWGGMGVLWNSPVAFVFIRPQRYTHDFTENSDRATLSFFKPDGETRKMLAYCGRVSGRNEDKISNAGITPVKTDGGDIGFEEAEVILSCRKLYADVLKEEKFTENSCLELYNGDFHTVYVYKIEGVYVKE